MLGQAGTAFVETTDSPLCLVLVMLAGAAVLCDKANFLGTGRLVRGRDTRPKVRLMSHNCYPAPRISCSENEEPACVKTRFFG
jgi:hypothetical protein